MYAKDLKKTNFRHNGEGTIIGNDLRIFSGKTSEIEAVLILLNEKVDMGVTFESFQEKLRNFALKNFKKAEDVITLIVDIQDPKPAFKAIHTPKPLEEKDEESPSKLRMWELQVKRFLDCQDILNENIVKIY